MGVRRLLVSRGWHARVNEIGLTRSPKKTSSIEEESISSHQRLSEAAVRDAWAVWRDGAVLGMCAASHCRRLLQSREFKTMTQCAAERMASHDCCGSTLASLLYRPGVSVESVEHAISVRRWLASGSHRKLGHWFGHWSRWSTKRGLEALGVRRLLVSRGWHALVGEVELARSPEETSSIEEESISSHRRSSEEAVRDAWAVWRDGAVLGMCAASHRRRLLQSRG